MYTISQKLNKSGKKLTTPSWFYLLNKIFLGYGGVEEFLIYKV